MVSGFSLFWVGITQKGFQKGWNPTSNPFTFLRFELLSLESYRFKLN
jgi:hypothetical protein